MQYQKPEVEIVLIEEGDIITSSYKVGQDNDDFGPIF